MPRCKWRHRDPLIGETQFWAIKQSGIRFSNISVGEQMFSFNFLTLFSTIMHGEIHAVYVHNIYPSVSVMAIFSQLNYSKNKKYNFFFINTNMKYPHCMRERICSMVYTTYDHVPVPGLLYYISKIIFNSWFQDYSPSIMNIRHGG